MIIFLSNISINHNLMTLLQHVFDNYMITASIIFLQQYVVCKAIFNAISGSNIILCVFSSVSININKWQMFYLSINISKHTCCLANTIPNICRTHELYLRSVIICSCKRNVRYTADIHIVIYGRIYFCDMYYLWYVIYIY